MDERRPTSPPSVYTVGHSNHSVEHFLQLLRGHGIEVVIDTRSFPYSKYAPQFNVDVLRNVIVGDENWRGDPRPYGIPRRGETAITPHPPAGT